jgi:uncharacterized protein (DUF58 family)
MTANGAFVAVGGLLALAGGLGPGYPAGFAVAVFCAALLLAGVPLRPLPGRSLHLELIVEPATVERETAVTVTIASSERAVARLRVGEERVELAVGGRTPAGWVSPPLPRGHLTIAVERLVAVGPLALWRRRIPFTGGGTEITVHPRHVNLAEAPELIDLDEDSRPARIGVGTGSAFAGLREYEPGDDLRHIDWAASARSGEGDLYVRHFAPALVEDRVVVLDPRLPARPGPGRLAAFEVAVDLVYSFVLAGADLVLDGEQDPVRGQEAARDVLIDLTPRTSGDAESAAVRPGGVVAVVTASPEHGDELRWAYGREVLILAITGPDSPPPPAHVVPAADLASAADEWSRRAAG